MCKGLLKRFVPFAAALVIGLFVASFFVTVAAPHFNFKRENSVRRYREARNLKMENQRLREELQQKQQKIAELEASRNMDFEGDFNKLIPPPPPAPMKRDR